MDHLILLATNLEGYRNLVKLTSFGYTEGFYYKPRIDRDLLQEHRGGLVGLSACLSGVPSQLVIHEKSDEAEEQALLFNEILGQGNYFLEVQKQTGIDVQDRVNAGLVEISRRDRHSSRGDERLAFPDARRLRRAQGSPVDRYG